MKYDIEIHNENNNNNNDDDDDDNDDDEYISRVLNPSVSNQPEAQSAVHVQLKIRQKEKKERCIVSCGSTSFPWLVFIFGALL